MTGKLYVIGVGPGDPELLTLKAVRVLREVPCICVPKGREEGNSLALSIVQKARIEGLTLEGKEIIEAHFPMRKTRNNQESENCELDTKWQETIETVYSRLNKGIDMAFITIGDPTIYSTFFYLYDKLL
ncbi:MAG TPA: precorrin-2 C(20)-methyltransferase, partial [Nitrospiraceae bacterium]|nr:precorrin-2 C(20)-methyltransferase [Nitrospiraceae bacterium]